MTFDPDYITEAGKPGFSANYYVVIDGFTNKYSKKPVVGLVTKELLSTIRFTLNTVTLDRASTTIGQLTLTLIDPSDEFLTDIKDNAIHERDIDVFLGFTEQDFSKYKKALRYKIRSVASRDGITYIVMATEARDDIRIRVEQPHTILSDDITAASDPIGVDSADVLDTPPATVRIEDELVDYSAKDDTVDEISTLSRGAKGSEADTHKKGTDVFRYLTFDVNPITMLLRLLTSPGGGCIYDVLDFGAGMLASKVDVTHIESVRDGTKLAGEIWRFHFDGEIPDLLRFIEEEILFWTNTRMFTDLDGKVDIIPVGFVELGGPQGTLQKRDFVGGRPPSWVMDSRRLYNRLNAKWDLNTGTRKHESIEEFNDTQSQLSSRFGIRKGKELKSSFIKSSLGGVAIIQDRIDFLFLVNAAPLPILKAGKVLFDKQFFDIGADVTIDHEDVPDPELGTRGINKTFEVLGRRIDPDEGTAEYTMHTNQWLNLRSAFIGPSADFTGSPAAGVFDVDSTRTKYFKTGHVIALWLKVGGTGPVDTETIDTVVGDTITLVNAFSVTPIVGTHILRYSTFSNVVEEQKQFAFVSGNGGDDFPDGTSPYQVQP